MERIMKNEELDNVLSNILYKKGGFVQLAKKEDSKNQMFYHLNKDEVKNVFEEAFNLMRENFGEAEEFVTDICTYNKFTVELEGELFFVYFNDYTNETYDVWVMRDKETESNN